MSFKQNLNDILVELDKHKRNRNAMLAACIQARLTKSLQSYYKELSGSVSYLKSIKDESKMIKRLNDDN